MTKSASKNGSAGEDRVRAVAAAGVVGGVAAGVWLTRRVRDYSRVQRPDGMIDWQRTREVAVSMNRGDTLTAVQRARLDAYYEDLVSQCIPIVSEYTGATLPPTDQRTYAFDRIDWIDANLHGFRRMFEPVEELDNSKSQKGPIGRVASGVNQAVLSYEIGLLLGYLARRVLGQYDLALLGREPLESTGKLYYVEPNIKGIEQKLGLPREEFRMWLALHETTHAFEFEAHPWVRVHFNSLLDQYMTFMKQDAEHLAQGVQGLKMLANRVRDGGEDRGSWIEALMNDEQRALFSEMQAMMCVIEGYSNHVMNAVGRDLLPRYDEIARKFEERQLQRTQSEKLFSRLTGLDVKMEQYRAGERFIDEIVRIGGHSTAVQVWSSPEFLPTMQEIRDPDQWIERTKKIKPLALAR
jgi:coenzyme F420 biosynthesis associated uncharacterized protein